MGKKVLVIGTSPRIHGNSNILAQAFVDGAKEAGNDVLFIPLAGKKIGFCAGCWGCTKTHRCVFHDDADMVVQKMKDANVVAFAVSGVIVARERKMDVFGASLLGCTTACGGGVIRDLLLGVIPPMLFRSPIYVIVAFVTSIITFMIFYYAKAFRPNTVADNILNFADSLGLGAFVVVGYQGGVYAGYSDNAFLCIFVGVLTGIGGGILRDILVGMYFMKTRLLMASADFLVD